MSSLKRKRGPSPSTDDRSLVSAENIPNTQFGCEFEVFLNFCGRDTRRSFIDYLYRSLRKEGICTFKDDEDHPKGENIEKILPAIKQSRISIPVFSKNYASREWCLRELVKMIKCRKHRNQVILPVFFDVKPHVVREQSDNYGKVFYEHLAKFNDEDIQNWRKALTEAGKISGWDLQEDFNGNQGELVDEIVSNVRDILQKANLNHQNSQLEILPNEINDSNFKENTNKVLALLEKDGTSRVGIYGIGGVGKTTLAMKICDLLKSQNNFRGIYWVTVSQDLAIYNLQSKIAKQIKVDLADDADEKIRAAELFQAFHKKGTFVLFCDDVWNYFPLETIGIRNALKGCKLILTSRSSKVCQEMGCNKRSIIKVETLSEVEAWKLFKEKIGQEEMLSDEIDHLARLITKECGGLPLAINTIARSLSVVEDVHEWRDTLKRLKESKEGHEGMDLEVIPALKLSYDRLKDTILQQCFCYVAVFPEDEEVERDRLIKLFIDVGLIDEGSWKADFDRGHTILNRHENASLLMGTKRYLKQWVKMHDLIRDMALRITRSKFMVKSGQSLKQQLEEKEWSSDLEVVSMMHCGLEDITISPRCPKMSTLLLSFNSFRKIPDYFFEYMSELKVLDLSDNSDIVELPNSVANLVKLTALTLCSCWNLERMPSLAKLSALRRLNLAATALEELPIGMENLIDLRELNINISSLRKIPTGILAKFSSLRSLTLPKDNMEAPLNVELANLNKLECLSCCLFDWNRYKASVKFIQSLQIYRILVGNYQAHYGSYTDRHINIYWPKVPREEFVVLPKNVESVLLWGVPKGEGLEEEKPMTQKIQSCQTFSLLKVLHIWDSNYWKKLFEPRWLSNLQNLEFLSIRNCRKLEKIVEAGESGVYGSPTLPKLRRLSLYGLPALEKIGEGMLVCDSLEVIKISFCPKIKRIPIALKYINGCLSSPSSHLEIQINQGSREESEKFWKSLEWDDPDAKKALQPLVTYWDDMRSWTS